jgi:hypothetical protein
MAYGELSNNVNGSRIRPSNLWPETLNLGPLTFDLQPLTVISSLPLFGFGCGISYLADTARMNAVQPKRMMRKRINCLTSFVPIKPPCL